jgi:probable rRNA maturation factor
VRRTHRRSNPTTILRHTLTVQYATARRGLPHRSSIERWLHTAAARPLTVCVRFVGTAEGRSLNRSYRNRDYATNVLSFPYDTTLQGAGGDLVLCAPVVAAEARTQRKSTNAHYAHLVMHGLLHLQGYDHERAADARRMESRETMLLGRLGYADPYQAMASAHRAGRA